MIAILTFRFSLTKEFANLSANPVSNIKLLVTSPTQPPPDYESQSSSSSMGIQGLLLAAAGPLPSYVCEWNVEITGAEGTLYAGEVFPLRFRFDERYPMSSPEVVFRRAPIHPHIYSNGHICLSILYDGWSPALSVMSVCLSLISMLSSCERKERPTDDQQYVAMCGERVSPKSMRWIFDDDTV